MKTRPELFVNTKNVRITDKDVQDSIYEETDEGSITPETFKSRIYFASSNNFDLLKDDKGIFHDHFEYSKQKVLRFGINIKSEKTQKIHSKKIAPLANQSLYDLSTVITKTGIKQSKIDDLSKKLNDLKGEITDLEEEILNSAITHLGEPNNNAVVIDIFDRKNVDKVEIHSVALYKENGKILIIDPSNSSYSQFLAGFDPQKMRAVLTKDIKIYQPAEKPGPKADNFRDCTDLAVKLALYLECYKASPSSGGSMFSLDEQLNTRGESLGCIKPDSLKNHPVIQTLTNNTINNPDIPSLVQDYSVKTKQSSDIVKASKANTILMFLHTAHKEIQSIKLPLYSKKKYKEMIENCITYSSDGWLVDAQKIFKDHFAGYGGVDDRLLGAEFQEIDDLFASS